MRKNISKEAMRFMLYCCFFHLQHDPDPARQYSMHPALYKSGQCMWPCVLTSAHKQLILFSREIDTPPKEPAICGDSLYCGSEMQGGDVKCIVPIFSKWLFFVGVLTCLYSILLIIVTG